MFDRGHVAPAYRFACAAAGKPARKQPVFDTIVPNETCATFNVRPNLARQGVYYALHAERFCWEVEGLVVELSVLATGEPCPALRGASLASLGPLRGAKV